MQGLQSRSPVPVPYGEWVEMLIQQAERELVARIPGIVSASLDDADYIADKVAEAVLRVVRSQASGGAVTRETAGPLSREITYDPVVSSGYLWFSDETIDRLAAVVASGAGGAYEIAPGCVSW